ncbi:Ribosomal protein S12 methylthiotransferase RimO [Labeo rohita]|uniref:Ribosomal protein S12 methylthiotransferase RimO n=1 Tax=Labeo rohita TaxID=84645 RepID=A0ABQ8MJW4_LABRO|nr:Ribosomal protein S12 methylthiotransferase RimO [Labeo rohita]
MILFVSFVNQRCYFTLTEGRIVFLSCSVYKTHEKFIDTLPEAVDIFVSVLFYCAHNTCIERIL